MLPREKPTAADEPIENFIAGQIIELAGNEYQDTARLQVLIDDVVALYQGKWPAYEACQVRYHNLHHALDVALVTARMIAGWNRKDTNLPIPAAIFLNAMAAALFHDAGYLKDKGDTEGSGGKYSFTHVKRSMKMARNYLKEKNWPRLAITSVPAIISITEFHDKVDPAELFDHYYTETVARMIGVADLIAQMADIDYMQRINYLFEELQEAYRFNIHNELEKRGIHIFSSAEEMRNNTVAFYEKFVLPRFQWLGRMDSYLNDYFSDDRNPYLENIAANLSGQLMGVRVPWYRLGEVLRKIEAVTDDQLEEALALQQKNDLVSLTAIEPSPIRQRLDDWQSAQSGGDHLGNILIQMNAINPSTLRQGLLSQMMPPELLGKMSKEEIIFLLEASMLLQNIGQDSWVLGQILEMTNEHLDCEASSILLADHVKREMLVAVATGPQKDNLQGKIISLDKGLAGWVHRHCQPAMVTNVEKDYRFDQSTDKNTGFITRSILAVPLHVKGDFIGAMELINKKTDNFSGQEIDLLNLLANIIAISLRTIFQV